jgi:hypothetical protein
MPDEEHGPTDQEHKNAKLESVPSIDDQPLSIAERGSMEAILEQLKGIKSILNGLNSPDCKASDEEITPWLSDVGKALKNVDAWVKKRFPEDTG